MQDSRVGELNRSTFVILHVPHGERAVVQTPFGVMFRGRSPFLTTICIAFQDVNADALNQKSDC